MKIVKVDGLSPQPTPAASKKQPQTRHSKKPAFGILKGGKTARSKARLEAVRDPARSPPTRKSTLRILTEGGRERRLRSIKQTVRSMPIAKVRKTLEDAGLPVKKAPDTLARQILEGGMEAGMIVPK